MYGKYGVGTTFDQMMTIREMKYPESVTFGDQAGHEMTQTCTALPGGDCQLSMRAPGGGLDMMLRILKGFVEMNIQAILDESPPAEAKTEEPVAVAEEAKTEEAKAEESVKA